MRLNAPVDVHPIAATRLAISHAACRFVEWYAGSRSHRVVCLVLGIWVINAFDLCLTLMSHHQGLLNEENPVACYFLARGPLSLILYKVSMVMLGSYSLLRFRHTRIAEMGAFIVVMIYALLAVRWQACYEFYALSSNGTVLAGEIDAITPYARP